MITSIAVDIDKKTIVSDKGACPLAIKAAFSLVSLNMSTNNNLMKSYRISL
jgi:hypothetical protein